MLMDCISHKSDVFVSKCTAKGYFTSILLTSLSLKKCSRFLEVLHSEMLAEILLNVSKSSLLRGRIFHKKKKIGGWCLVIVQKFNATSVTWQDGWKPSQLAFRISCWNLSIYANVLKVHDNYLSWWNKYLAWNLQHLGASSKKFSVKFSVWANAASRTILDFSLPNHHIRNMYVKNSYHSR